MTEKAIWRDSDQLDGRALKHLFCSDCAHLKGWRCSLHVGEKTIVDGMFSMYAAACSDYEPKPVVYNDGHVAVLADIAVLEMATEVENG